MSLFVTLLAVSMLLGIFHIASLVQLFYFSFIVDVRTPAIKLFYFTFILVLFYFYCRCPDALQ